MSFERCPKHPKYIGLMPPHSDCKACWQIYRIVHPAAKGSK